MFHNQNSKTRLKDLIGKQSKSIFHNGSDKIRRTGSSRGRMVKLHVQHLIWPRWDLEWLYDCNWVLEDREDWAGNHVKKKWSSSLCWQKKLWEGMNVPQSITWTKPSVKVNAEQNSNSTVLLKQTGSAALLGYKLQFLLEKHFELNVEHFSVGQLNPHIFIMPLSRRMIIHSLIQ